MAGTDAMTPGNADRLRDASRVALVVAGLCLLSLAAFSGVARLGFVFDDTDYLLRNPHLANGFRWENLRFLLTASYEANWYPLTWLSHLVDLQLFGARPAGHHLVSLGLHAAGTAGLFLVLRAATGALWRSALVAALFAVHPLRVESVAWVAERKDVLSGLLWVAATGAYLRFARRRGRGAYLAALALFALGLAAKPMLVTLPFALLLLDFWPLGRLGPGRTAAPPAALLLEKVPFLALAAAASVVTYRAQLAWGALGSGAGKPLALRLANAAVSYLRYLRDTAFPLDLAAFHPYPAAIPAATALAAVALLAAATAGALALRRRAPWATVGWLWFLGTLVPVIGLVQAGAQARADRYTYLPSVGIFLVAAWGPTALLSRRQGRHGGRPAPAPGAIAACAALALLATATRLQVTHWRDDRALFAHAAAATRDNFFAHTNLGAVLAAEGRTQEAIAHLTEAVRINPRMDTALFNLGVLLERSGRTAEAEVRYRAALQANPANGEAHINLGRILLARGLAREAADHFRPATRPGPYQALAHANLGAALEALGDLPGARQQYRLALRLDPGNAAVATRLAVLEARP